MNAQEARTLRDLNHARKNQDILDNIYDQHPLFIRRIDNQIEMHAKQGNSSFSLENAARLVIEDERNNIPSPYPHGSPNLPFEFLLDALQLSSLNTKERFSVLSSLSELSNTILREVCSYYIRQGYSAYTMPGPPTKGLSEYTLHISWES